MVYRHQEGRSPRLHNVDIELGREPAGKPSLINSGTDIHAPVPLIAVYFLLIGFLVILPAVFCFALYRDEGTLRISNRLQWLAAAAAVVYGVLMAVEVTGSASFFGSYWAAMKALDWSKGALPFGMLSRTQGPSVPSLSCSGNVGI